MADTPGPQPTEPSMTNTPDSVCGNCGSNPPHLAQSTMPSDTGQIDSKPWCERCIVDRFNKTRDDENSYPFVMNTVEQDPAIAEYHSIFDEAYMRDWHTKTSQWIWNISAELRLCCDCPSAPFVGELRPIGELKRDDEISDYSSCAACSKRWCMRCGIPVGPSYGNASNHSGPTF